MIFGVIVFPGSNCDHDCEHVANIFGDDCKMIWHDSVKLPEEFYDNSQESCIIIPGGFSYGDYLRSGAIASFAKIIEEVKTYANNGGKVIGICNGFQVLTEIGLLPGALYRNKNLKFICKDIYLKVENTLTPFSHKYTPNEVIKVPIAHGEGNYYCDEETLKDLKENNQIVFRYADANGTIDEETNPNGSIYNIAGICNKQRNVLGMMPHPERCAEDVLGNSDGGKVFESIISKLS